LETITNIKLAPLTGSSPARSISKQSIDETKSERKRNNAACRGEMGKEGLTRGTFFFLLHAIAGIMIHEVENNRTIKPAWPI
jgi:hypothetical protein